MVYVKRELEKKILKYLRKKEILAIVGTRQCGKTTLINNILDNFNESRRIKRISFDNVKDLWLFEEDIDSFIDLYVKNYDILFIDEVHYSRDSGKKLKYIYDNYKIKIIISGSSSTDISINSLKYLIGRIFVFTLYPFSFSEFLSYKDSELFNLYNSREVKGILLEKLNKYLEEFILYGGYPRVVIAETIEEKKKVLESIFNIYFLKEVQEILDLSNNYHLLDLIKALSLQIGNIINYNELSKLTGFSYLDLRKYLSVLEKTYICSLVKPFFTNKRTEIVKSPKVYFFDLGFRNIAIDNFSKKRSDLGSLYENFIFSELLKDDLKPKYWNSKSLAEVDFVIEKDNKVIPIEVKSILKDSKITRSFNNFIKKYNVKKGYILSLDFTYKKTSKGCSVNFMPFVNFLNKFSV